MDCCCQAWWCLKEPVLIRSSILSFLSFSTLLLHRAPGLGGGVGLTNPHQNHPESPIQNDTPKKRWPFAPKSPDDNSDLEIAPLTETGSEVAHPWGFRPPSRFPPSRHWASCTIGGGGARGHSTSSSQTSFVIRRTRGQTQFTILSELCST